MKKKLSIIFSIYNEADNIKYSLDKVINILKKIKKINYEIIVVNDNSTDDSLKILLSLRKKNKNIKIITLSRRFGHMPGIWAGIKHSSGDALIYMDIDLQDPPELIPKMVNYWLNEKYDVIITTRKKRLGESFFKKFISYLGYKFLRISTYIRIYPNSGDYRLINRKVIEYILKFKEKNPFYRFLVDWVGFRQKQIFYERQPRKRGVTKFPIGIKIFNQFFDYSLIPFSNVLIRFVFFIGILSFFTSLILMAKIMIGFFNNENIPGWTALMITILFFGSTSSLSLGILSIYIMAIFNESKNRPLYIIDKVFGIKKN
jgi:dolichol-phosphate mannosyltransferase